MSNPEPTDVERLNLKAWGEEPDLEAKRERQALLLLNTQ
jgi:hypothetical protein